MPTHASPLANEPWTHDWNFEVVGQHGDPDEGPTYGTFVTIKAASDDEAERRALIYLINNFDDPDRHRAVATSTGVLTSAEGTPEDTYRVRLDFPYGGQ